MGSPQRPETQAAVSDKHRKAIERHAERGAPDAFEPQEITKLMPDSAAELVRQRIESDPAACLCLILRLALGHSLLTERARAGASYYTDAMHPQAAQFLTGKTNALPDVQQPQRSVPEGDRLTDRASLVSLRKMYEEKRGATGQISPRAHRHTRGGSLDAGPVTAAQD